ncbi:MAG: hypothetical protein ACKVX9_15060, partial [Blastocatellia bacterium]
MNSLKPASVDVNPFRMVSTQKLAGHPAVAQAVRQSWHKLSSLCRVRQTRSEKDRAANVINFGSRALLSSQIRLRTPHKLDSLAIVAQAVQLVPHTTNTLR